MMRTAAAVVACVLTAGTASAQERVRLTLTDAIARGFETSHRVAEVRARELGAQAAARNAAANKLPVLNASAGYTRTNHVVEFAVPQPNGTRIVVYPDVPDNYVARLSFQWPIYTSGRADALERAAEAEASAVAADIDTTRADLKFEIVRAYWAVATAREAVRVLEESSARADAQLEDARQRFKVGLIPPNEVSGLEAQRSRERAQLIEASNTRESASIELRRLTGLPPDAVIELVDALDASAPAPAGLPDVADAVKEALGRRPERMALSFRLGGAEAREEAAQAINKPTIGLGGGYDWGHPNAKIFPRQAIWQDSFDVGVSVSWNFLDFGRTKAQAAEAAAAVQATRERLAEFDSVVAADVRQRMLDVDSSRALVQAASDAVTSAADARRVIADRFAAGVATSTDVLVAQVQLLEAELGRTRALAGVRLAEARLDRVLGR
jgi:outer membrane protein TolC